MVDSYMIYLDYTENLNVFWSAEEAFFCSFDFRNNSNFFVSKSDRKKMKIDSSDLSLRVYLED